jgi:hypothetical protein
MPIEIKLVEYCISGKMIHDPFEFGISSYPGIIVFDNQTNFTHISSNVRAALQYVIKFVKSSTARSYFSLLDCTSYPHSNEDVPLGSRKEGMTNKRASFEALEVSRKMAVINDAVDNLLWQTRSDQRAWRRFHGYAAYATTFPANARCG